MSGLAVLFHRDGRPVEDTMIRSMLDAVPYRGPDGMRALRWGAVALGHAKLAVTPEEQSEQQPLVSPRTGCALIADARLDNRDDLLAELPDRPPHTASDGELILRAYETWGLDVAARLLGDFAFAIWDPRDRRIVCARDTSAQRTLFYRIDHRAFAAASEIHQLFQDPSVPITPNEDRIRDYMTPFNIFQNEKDSASTFYENIYAIPAAHLLIVDRESVRIQRYWRFEPPAELRYRNADEYTEHFRDLFFKVVQARLRTSRPIGMMLSGGLDSSSVACTAQELYRRHESENHGFTSFSLVWEGLDCDERPAIRDIEEKYGFDAQYINPGIFTGRLDLEPRGFIAAPFLGVNEKDALLSAASRAGVRTMLTGDLGDSLSGTFLFLDRLLRRGQFRDLWRYLQATRRIRGESYRRIILHSCLAPLLPLELQKRLMVAYVGRGTFERELQRQFPFWLTESVRKDLIGRQMRLCLTAERERRFSNPGLEMEYQALYPPEDARPPLGWPLEISRPYTDRRLHELIFTIPPERRFELQVELQDAAPDDQVYAGAKQLVRRAMAGVVPESIRTRASKQMFTSLVVPGIEASWAKCEAAFGPGNGSRSEIARRGYVNPEHFWLRLEALRRGVIGAPVFIRYMFQLETWLRALTLARPQLTTVATRWGEPEMIGGASSSTPQQIGLVGSMQSTESGVSSPHSGDRPTWP